MLPWRVSGGIAAGGVNQVVLNLFDQMKAQGKYEPLLLENYWGSAQLAEFDLNGRKLYSLRHRPCLGNIKISLMYFITLPLALLKLRNFILENNIQVVNAHYPSLAVINYVLLKKLGLADIKVVLSVHGRDIRDLENFHGLKRKLFRWVYRNADRIVACSQGLADDASNILPIPKEQLRIVHNGIQAEAFAEIAKSATLNYEPDSYLLNVGTYEYKKGHDVLLRAFEKVARKIPEIKLVIAGRKTPYYEETVKLVEELNLQSRVDLLSDLSHQEVAGLLKNAKLFLLPSRNEGFAISLLEAGALEKAVIAADVCGVGELIMDGKDGLLIKSEDFHNLADNICLLIKQKDMAKELAANLYNKVTTYYSWDAAVDKYNHCLQ